MLVNPNAHQIDAHKLWSKWDRFRPDNTNLPCRPSGREPGTGSMNKEAILNRTSDHMIKNMKFTYDLLDDWCFNMTRSQNRLQNICRPDKLNKNRR